VIVPCLLSLTTSVFGGLVRQSRRSPTEPTAAYGPAGSTGELNISVVVAPILPGFRLESLGNPSEAAQRFLDTIVAPEGSNREAVLISADERYVLSANQSSDNDKYTFPVQGLGVQIDGSPTSPNLRLSGAVLCQMAGK
jgi:hypothetical protein